MADEETIEQLDAPPPGPSVQAEHDDGEAEHSDVEVEREHDAPAELDAETRARRDAALRRVRQFGDPVLRASALEVERFDEDLRVEIEQMGELMHDALGIGLAATQLGVLPGRGTLGEKALLILRGFGLRAARGGGGG